jgi:type I restriction enzyme S subunit
MDLAKNVSYLQRRPRLIRLTDLRENLSNEGIYVSEESHTFSNQLYTGMKCY